MRTRQPPVEHADQICSNSIDCNRSIKDNDLVGPRDAVDSQSADPSGSVSSGRNALMQDREMRCAADDRTEPEQPCDGIAIVGTVNESCALTAESDDTDATIVKVEQIETLADAERYMRAAGMTRSVAKALVSRIRSIREQDEELAELANLIRRTTASLKGH